MLPRGSFVALPSQTAKLDERHTDGEFSVESCGMNIIVEPGVYQTSGDSSLMAESVEISPDETFLEIGCGTGVVSLAVARRAKQGIGADINERAVENSKRNAAALGVSNVEFRISDVFGNIEGVFDVIICNPPYTDHAVRDTIDRMFWDPENEMKRRFFAGAGAHLKPNGRIYFGWADFADIETDLPLRLAEENGLQHINTFSKPHRSDFTFYVLEFTPQSLL